MTGDLVRRLSPHLRVRVHDPEGHRLREGGFVLYWMRTGVRGHENPALDCTRDEILDSCQYELPYPDCNGIVPL